MSLLNFINREVVEQKLGYINNTLEAGLLLLKGLKEFATIINNYHKLYSDTPPGRYERAIIPLNHN